MSAKNTLPVRIAAFFVLGTSQAFGEQSTSSVIAIVSKKEAKRVDVEQQQISVQLGIQN